MVSTAGVIALALHVPGRLDLMIKGALGGRNFFGKVVLCVTKQIDTDNSCNSKYDDLIHNDSFWDKT